MTSEEFVRQYFRRRNDVEHYSIFHVKVTFHCTPDLLGSYCQILIELGVKQRRVAIIKRVFRQSLGPVHRGLSASYDVVA